MNNSGYKNNPSKSPGNNPGKTKPGNGKPDDELAAIRNRLMSGGIDESEVPSDPFELFEQWLSFAFEVGIFNANAMTLATVAADGRPSVRNVLARPIPNTRPTPNNSRIASVDSVGASDAGAPDAGAPDNSSAAVAFYTDANSHKARDLSGNENVAAVFSWLPLERQVRMDGRVTLLSDRAVVDYFKGRPPEAQIAMLASQQSEPAANRRVIERQFAEVQPAAATATTEAAEQADEIATQLEISDHWNGYLLHPHRVEFWQGRSDRIHDRLVYQLDASSTQPEPTWLLSRLQP